MPTIYILWQLLQIVALLYHIFGIYIFNRDYNELFGDDHQLAVICTGFFALTVCVVAGGMWKVAGLRALRV